MSFALLADAAYALDVDEDAWVRGLCTHASPLLDEGLGVFAYSYGVMGDRVTLDSVAFGGEAVRGGGSVWDSLNRWGARNQGIVAALYRARPVQVVSSANVATRLSNEALGDLRSTFEPHDVRDMLAFVAHHRSGSGVILTVPVAAARPVSLGLERTFLDVGSALATIVHLRRRWQSARRSVSLTPKERQVALLLVSGCSDKEIAHELQCAMSTVSTLVQRIRKKVGCEQGQELLHLAEPDAGQALSRRRSLFDRLTATEREVAVALVTGATYDGLARERGCTKRTIATQVASIFRKSGLSGRRALAAAILGDHVASGK